MNFLGESESENIDFDGYPREFRDQIAARMQAGIAKNLEAWRAAIQNGRDSRARRQSAAGAE